MRRRISDSVAVVFGAVNFVTFFDALQFANWIENGEGNGDTETGACTLLGGTETPSNGATALRNPDAEVVLATQGEWFKAAYYDGPIDTDYEFPAGSDTAPNCTPSALLSFYDATTIEDSLK